MTYFKLPITYTNECYNVDNNIITDLELMNSDNFLYKRFLIQMQLERKLLYGQNIIQQIHNTYKIRKN